MSLLAPGFLWLGAVLTALLVFLYFLKLKRRELMIPSTMLWRYSIEDIRVNAPFRKFRSSLLLILQLLILAALIWALVRPAINARAGEEQTYIILIDTSASMEATDVEGGRLGVAKEEARKVIDTMQGDDQAMVITFAEKASIVSTFSSDKGVLADRIKRIEARDTRTEFAEALKIAHSYATRSSKPPIVYVISDGRFERVEGLSLAAADVRYIPIGQEGNNVAITTLSASRDAQRPDRLKVLVHIRNYAEREVRLICELLAEDVVVDARELTLEAHSAKPCLFELGGFSEGVLATRLTVEDDLAVDNEAWTTVESRTLLRVLLVGPGNWFLQRVLESAGGIELASASPETYEQAASDPAHAFEFDVIVFDRARPAQLPPVAAVFIGTDPGYSDLTASGTSENPIVLDWDRGHPLLSYVNLDDLMVAKALRFPASDNAVVLVSSDEGPLMLTYARQDVIDTVISFDILDSDWPLRLSYPLFFSNLVRYYSELLSSGAGSVATGGTIRIPLRDSEKSVAVVDPTGAAHAVPRTAEDILWFSATGRAGIYTVLVDGKPQMRYAANLLDPAESDIAPAEEVKIGYEAIVGDRSVVRENQELWKIFAYVALAVLLVEWYVFNRKVSL